MHKPMKFKKRLNILVVICLVLSLLLCLSFMDTTLLYTTRPFISIPSGWNLSIPKYRNVFSGVGIQESVSENTQASSRSAGKLSDYTSKLSSEPLENVTYHGHDLLNDPPFKFDKRFKNPCWYVENQLNCLPYFLLIGVKKCGTSDLFTKLVRHPKIIFPKFKEAQFFARVRFKNGNDSIQVYVNKFKNAAADIHTLSPYYFQAGKMNPYITGEGSPSNLHLNTHWMHLPGNEHLSEPRVVILDYIKHFLPNAKIIVIFRDPVERLYSDYFHEFGNLRKSNNPNPQQFHDIVTNGVNLYTRCFEQRSVRSCIYDPKLYDQTKVQMQLGIYYIYWQELLRVFSREQIFVIQNRDLNNEEALGRLYTFLELEPLTEVETTAMLRQKPKYQRRAAFRKKGPMFNSTFNILYEFYKPFNEKMAAITQDQRFLYEHELKLYQ